MCATTFVCRHLQSRAMELRRSRKQRCIGCCSSSRLGGLHFAISRHCVTCCGSEWPPVDLNILDCSLLYPVLHNCVWTCR